MTIIKGDGFSGPTRENTWSPVLDFSEERPVKSDQYTSTKENWSLPGPSEEPLWILNLLLARRGWRILYKLQQRLTDNKDFTNYTHTLTVCFLIWEVCCVFLWMMSLIQTKTNQDEGTYVLHTLPVPLLWKVQQLQEPWRTKNLQIVETEQT